MDNDMVKVVIYEDGEAHFWTLYSISKELKDFDKECPRVMVPREFYERFIRVQEESDIIQEKLRELYYDNEGQDDEE